VLVEGFSKLLSDPEAEVRTAAAFKIGEMAKAFGPSKTTNQLLGNIKTLARDTCQVNFRVNIICNISVTSLQHQNPCAWLVSGI
jgi:hypothetical protein